jgi:hypothetical protein
MTESTNPETPRPSGDQPRPINPDAVRALLEAGRLVTESELTALAESEGQQRPLLLMCHDCPLVS